MKLSSITDVTPSKLLYYKTLDRRLPCLEVHIYYSGRSHGKKDGILQNRNVNSMNNQEWNALFYENCFLSKNANIFEFLHGLSFLIYLNQGIWNFFLRVSMSQLFFPIWIMIAMIHITLKVRISFCFKECSDLSLFKQIDLVLSKCLHFSNFSLEF